MATIAHTRTTKREQRQLQHQYAWCCVGEFDDCSPEDGNHNNNSRTGGAQQQGIRIHRIAGYQTEHNIASATMGDDAYAFDLTKSSDWMEFVEGSGNQSCGAYDTIRCDLVLRAPPSSDIKNKWTIWGLDYHLQRLQRSFETLQSLTTSTSGNNDNTFLRVTNSAIGDALEQSRRLFDALLHEAATANVLRKQNDNRDEGNKDMSATWIQLIRFTWLWTLAPLPSSSSHSSSLHMPRIRVFGHACSSAQPFNVHQTRKKPIVASIAATCSSDASNGSHRNDNNNMQIFLDRGLPQRHNHHPTIKLTQWTRQRKQLEQEHAQRYQKANDNDTAIGEVLLVHDGDNHKLQLLEGLSSNVFVIYKDGSLATANDTLVLPGYARHLVLQAFGANGGGDFPSVRPILLDEVDQWQEVFITSSSRLILPVRKIVIPTTTALVASSSIDPASTTNTIATGDSSADWVEFWSVDARQDEEATPKWHQLELELLRLGGY